MKQIKFLSCLIVVLAIVAVAMTVILSGTHYAEASRPPTNTPHPTHTPQPTNTPKPTEAQFQPVNICHWTPSHYVEITVDDQGALDGHLGHPNDIIGATFPCPEFTSTATLVPSATSVPPTDTPVPPTEVIVPTDTQEPTEVVATPTPVVEPTDTSAPPTEVAPTDTPVPQPTATSNPCVEDGRECEPTATSTPKQIPTSTPAATGTQKPPERKYYGGVGLDLDGAQHCVTQPGKFIVVDNIGGDLLFTWVVYGGECHIGPVRIYMPHEGTNPYVFFIPANGGSAIQMIVVNDWLYVGYSNVLDLLWP